MESIDWTTVVVAFFGLLGTLLTVLSPLIFLYVQRAAKKKGIELTEAHHKYWTDRAREGLYWTEEQVLKATKQASASDHPPPPVDMTAKRDLAVSYMLQQASDSRMKPPVNPGALVEAVIYKERPSMAPLPTPTSETPTDPETKIPTTNPPPTFDQDGAQ